MKVNLLDLDRSAMEQWFASTGEKPFRARQVLRWIHQRGAEEFDAGHALTDLEEAAKRGGFKIGRTMIEASGVCSACQAA